MSFSLPIKFFSATLLLSLLIYWLGIPGIFLLDDYVVLPTLGSHHDLGTGRALLLYLLENDHTGPAGRPLSLISFYMNAQQWPTDPTAFKLTNIFLHLFNGILLLWLVNQLVNYLKPPLQYSQWLGVLAAGLWIIHPFQISSVLYVVQRMTELSTLFTLVSLLIYLYGRETLVNKPTSLRYYAQFSTGLILTGTLAVLSKENGVLMLGYLLVLEFCLVRNFSKNAPQHWNRWLTLFVVLPFLLVVLYILISGLNAGAYLARPFTLEERLLTEARILLDYIANIMVPGLSTPTLFHDDYPLSKSWLEPWTTLPSVLLVTTLLAIGVLRRKQWPVLSFAILWFLCGHLLESTVIPLEVYFEHRNYLPLFGPAFAIVYFSLFLIERFPNKQKATLAGMSLYTFLMIGTLALNTSLWGNPLQLIIGWSQEHPSSPRYAFQGEKADNRLFRR